MLLSAMALSAVLALPAFAADPPPLINVLHLPPGMAGPRVPAGDMHSASGFFPLHAAICGEHGQAIVELTIGSDGAVSDVHLFHSSGFADLDVDAVAAVSTWRYLPATQDGKPVAVRWQADVLYGRVGPVHGEADCSPAGTQAAADALTAALHAP